MRLIHLINSTFLCLKIIVDTLIDVGNAKHQNITSKIRQNKHIALRMIQSVSGHGSKQTTAHSTPGQLYRS